VYQIHFTLPTQNAYTMFIGIQSSREINMRASILSIFLFLFSTCFTLVGCSTLHNKSNETQPSVSNIADRVETQGLGEDNDQIVARDNQIENIQNIPGKDVGPANGLLGIRSFYFDFDSYTVAAKNRPAINAHAHYLLTHPHSHVIIEGNADIRGSREYNIALGQKRADAIIRLLKLEGVPSKQIRSLSYGAERPIALGNSEADYRLNRRDDIVYEAG
jgi:peptidoglycan-associated lipoprotein